MPAAGGSDPNQPEPQERDGAATGFQSWSAEGSRASVIDPRRRLGGHGQARRLLVVDHGAAAMAQGVWRGLLSALQRHTVQSALVEMTAEERDVLTLAYQEGRTNSEIASVMGVSERTVRRRLSVALARLEEFSGRAGAWISAMAIVGVLYMLERGARVGRGATAWRPSDWSATLAGAVAIGAVTAVGVGLAVADHAATTPQHSRPPVISGINVLPSRVVELTAVTPDAPSNDPTKTGAEAGPPAVKTTGGSDESNEASDQESPGSLGCHGNPTSAPPPVPVGPRGDHPSGAPVTHPGPGGCKSD